MGDILLNPFRVWLSTFLLPTGCTGVIHIKPFGLCYLILTINPEGIKIESRPVKRGAQHTTPLPPQTRSG